MNQTNNVRILIANGAGVDEATKSLGKVGADDAVKLIRQVQSELREQLKSTNGIKNFPKLRSACYTVNDVNQYTQRTNAGYLDIQGLALATIP